MMTREMIRQVELLNGSTPNGMIIDSDTILADLLLNVDNEVSGFSQDIFNIYKRSKDKDAVKQIFFEFTGTEFDDYLDKCMKEITR
jgi:hypothetical protein